MQLLNAPSYNVIYYEAFKTLVFILVNLKSRMQTFFFIEVLFIKIHFIAFELFVLFLFKLCP